MGIFGKKASRRERVIAAVHNNLLDVLKAVFDGMPDDTPINITAPEQWEFLETDDNCVATHLEIQMPDAEPSHFDVHMTVSLDTGHCNVYNVYEHGHPEKSSVGMRDSVLLDLAREAKRLEQSRQR